MLKLYKKIFRRQIPLDGQFFNNENLEQLIFFEIGLITNMVLGHWMATFGGD